MVSTGKKHKKEKEKEDNYDVVIGMDYGVASFSSWSKSTWNQGTPYEYCVLLKSLQGNNLETL
jgi:hypothetical protein